MSSTKIIENIEDPNIFYDKYDSSKNITSKYLSKYEKTKVIYERIQQISNGSISYLNDVGKYDNIIDIVNAELSESKIPFIIKRKIGDNYEYWRLSDMIIL